MQNCIIGVTGPIAAGKNAACAILEQKGFVSLDADSLTHRIIEEKQSQILDSFLPIAAGQGVRLRNADGTIDRKALGKILFADPEALKKQETIVHPEVNRLFEEFITSHTDCPMALNATLLYKIPVLARCQVVLYIDAPWVWRFFRVKRRNHLKSAEIFARFRSQSHIYTQYCAKNADIYRVRNIGNLGSLEKKIDRFLRYCEDKGYGKWNKNNHCGLSPR
ncbi:MAG: dephospho-CoA kinase [Treponema sp.]|jgi:dephospho-CoA kinase|nr:dephospho-CoA kinase [Treponema sp.]